MKTTKERRAGHREHLVPVEGSWLADLLDDIDELERKLAFATVALEELVEESVTPDGLGGYYWHDQAIGNAVEVAKSALAQIRGVNTPVQLQPCPHSFGHPVDPAKCADCAAMNTGVFIGGLRVQVCPAMRGSTRFELVRPGDPCPACGLINGHDAGPVKVGF